MSDAGADADHDADQDPGLAARPDQVEDASYRAGAAARRAVLGDTHVDGSLASADEFSSDFQDFLTRHAWGAVWTRPGLDWRTRSCITLALLAGLGRAEELPLHVRGALNNGLTREEIKEVLLHTAVYAGVPAANTAFAVARRTLAEIDGEPS